jgi:phage terminase large subunit-like protein
VPKKNGKSPLLAALGCYLLFGDGEYGQKVFTCARDGQQAMIAHRHGMGMVKASPHFNCRPAANTGRMWDEATQSTWSVVAGDNINSQEGLNGSALVDECHVVDRRLMDVMKYMGRSRAEPLRIEVSTAGNNPEGYGKARFDLGISIAEGITKRDDLLFVCYSAPQDVNDAEIDADPIKYIRMANPAVGHILDEKLLLKEYEDARKSISELSTWKMYTLNIWQRTSNPWIKMGDWIACKEKFTDADLQGCEVAGAALDMNRVNDMAALALVFRHPEREDWVRLREVAKEHAHEGPFLDWARDGYLILTPGSTTDISFIRSFVIEQHRKTPFSRLAYDEWNADGLTQELADGARTHNGDVISEGLGIERVPFPQTIQNFAGPTDLFESMVIEKKLRHNGCPCLAWQVGHVQVWRDAAGNKRPVKPDGKKESIKKIDGVVASVMALAIYQARPVAEPGIFILD